MKTKNKKSKRSFTRKKRGGAHGLVLNIMYNKNGEIVDIQSDEILATKEYQDVNHINPVYGLTDLMRDAFNFRDVIRNTHEFFHPFDTQQNTKKRYVKIAINDKRDIQLIKITNNIIKALNTIPHKNMTTKFIVIRRNGKPTKECQENFKHQYGLLLRAFEDDILDEFRGNEKYQQVVKQMLRTPVLVNLVSIKFGLLRKGDLKMEEIRKMYKDTDELNASLSQLQGHRHRNIVGIDQIDDEKNKMLQKTNEELKEQIKEIEKLNCSLNGSCPVTKRPLFLNTETPLGMTSSLETSNPETSNPETSNPQTSNKQTSNKQTSKLETSNPQTSNKQTSNPQTSNKQTSKLETSNPRKSSTMTNEEFEAMIDKNPQLSAMINFHEMLMRKFPHKIQEGKTESQFYNFVSQNPKQTFRHQFMLQSLVIDNILTCLDIKKEIVEPNSEGYGERVYQAVVLTMIRIILTPSMKNYPLFKESFDKYYKGGPICPALKTATNSLSTFGWVRLSFSYDDIVNSFSSDCGNNDMIIMKNFNDLYTTIDGNTPSTLLEMVKKSFP